MPVVDSSIAGDSSDGGSPDHLKIWLKEKGYITNSQSQLASREAKRLGVPFSNIVLKLGLITSEELTYYQSFRSDSETAKDFIKENNIKTNKVTLRRLVLDDSMKSIISSKLCDTLNVIPIAQEDGKVIFAASNPFDLPTIQRLETETGLSVETLPATETEIRLAINRNYNEEENLYVVAGSFLEMDEEKLSEQSYDDPPMIKLAEQILLHAATREASDVHIHPEERFLRVRFRIDGILEEGLLLPKAIQSALTARFKILAEMDTAEDRLPQDGRIYFSIGMETIDIRVSSLPCNNGESIVMRLLDQSNLKLELPVLGFTKESINSFDEVLSSPHGVFLITGPTGSGKTTTLYTLLSMIDAEERSIFTLEDPIEYRLPMIRQTQIKSDIGLTFSSGLRTLLRQDPDVILVGETRDEETAELMVRAALTGHLVFSTLHTNDAISSISRLRDLGIPPFLLANSLIGLSAQRLVRRLCNVCKKPVKISSDILSGFEQTKHLDKIDAFESVGCNACAGKGFSGRVSISEIILVDKMLKGMIEKNENLDEIKMQLVEKGVSFMSNDAILKVQEGLTSFKEVQRVISFDQRI